MNNKDEIFQILEELKRKELDTGRKRYNALPHLFFFIGVGAGILFILSSNIIHEIGKKLPGDIYEIVVLILTVIFVVWLFRYLQKFHLRPIGKSEKEIDSLVEKLKRELIK